MAEVLCIGHAAYDINVPLDSFPVENRKIETPEFLEEGGGPAANAAFLLGMWGIKSAFAGLLGNDFYGGRLLDEFAAAEINTSLSVKMEGYVTPVSVILVNRQTGSRTIINRKIAGKYLELDEKVLSEMRPEVLLFDGHELEAALRAMAVLPRAVTILDAGSLREGTEILSGKVDYLVSSERFALSLTGLPDLNSSENCLECVKRLYVRNGKHVTVTLGERGLIFYDGTTMGRLPAFPVKTVDTTGAGDIFHGAFTYGILRKVPLYDTLKLASVTAALSVTLPGARRSIPPLPKVLEALKNWDL